MGDKKRRVTILEAAGRLFGHYGPAKTTISDIAKEARVGVGTVYLEFRSKDAILSTLSSRRHARVLVAVERAWSDGRPAPERLERALAARIEGFLHCGRDGAHGADLFACSSPAVERAHADFVARERALFARFLREGAERGELAVSDPELEARALLLAFEAFAPPAVFRHPTSSLEADLARVSRLVLRGLLPR
jgi:AcrR family transcriptional regulator